MNKQLTELSKNKTLFKQSLHVLLDDSLFKKLNIYYQRFNLKLKKSFKKDHAYNKGTIKHGSSFSFLPDMYSTVMHELAHSTRDILNRQLSYEEEECVAEMVSSILMQLLGYDYKARSYFYCQKYSHQVKVDLDQYVVDSVNYILKVDPDLLYFKSTVIGL